MKIQGKHAGYTVRIQRVRRLKLSKRTKEEYRKETSQNKKKEIFTKF